MEAGQLPGSANHEAGAVGGCVGVQAPSGSLCEAALVAAYVGHAEPRRTQEAWPYPGPGRTHGAHPETGLCGLGQGAQASEHAALTQILEFSISCCRVFPKQGLRPSEAGRGAPPLSGQDLRADHPPRGTFATTRRRRQMVYALCPSFASPPKLAGVILPSVCHSSKGREPSLSSWTGC